MVIGSTHGVDYAMTEPRQPQRTGPRTSETEVAAPGAVVRYLTIHELAASTTLSVSTLRRLLKKGKLVGHQPGGPRTRIVFRPDAIEQVVTAMTEAATDEPPHQEAANARQHGPRPKWQQAR
jgi:excisionase family DNA binding protein